MIIFYDGMCPLCNRAVRFLLAADAKKQFYFAPLEGETAQSKLKNLRSKHPDLDTLVLYINADTVLIEGRAALRILWVLGGRYALLGWLSFLPSFLFDAIYRLVARYRFRLFSKKVTIDKTDRFLS
ncbi:MAG: hypothetical protein S4CHLAM2_11090 [Chlamydiales bacterium]|nr:hypothetical protein [Chlamydiales bacterium]